MTINELFATTVERFADRPALSEPLEGGTIATLTFRELQERARHFAGHLQEQGIEKADRVLLWAASCSDWMVAYLGTLLVGAIVVPLDVSSKEDFLKRIVENTEARLLITTRKQHAGLQAMQLPFIDIEALPAGTLDTNRLPRIEDSDLAELVFTSGTTGQPKGVMLSHGNITSNAMAAPSVVNMRSEDRSLSILPLSHMLELTVELALLYCGASVVYARSLAPDTLLKLLSSQHITCMILVPQALQLFLSGIEREVRRQKKEKQWELLHRVATRLPFRMRRALFASVHKRFGGRFRFFVSGGAYLPLTLATRWENMGFRVMQGYGATECSPVIGVTPYREHVLTAVGKPLPGVDVRIAQDGEILVHGPNVAQGYWKNQEATDAAFKDGWYQTGDLGSVDKKNYIYLKGRKKNLIVLANGLNVYPEDIENILTSQADVKDAVVLGIQKENEGAEVHCMLLLNDSTKAKAIVQQTNKQLAAHQQIRGFTVWPGEDFPRTHTLKVKRLEVLDALQKLRQAPARKA
ncbi:MAG: AMP-binding protein [Chloroflexota bacterium]|nr:AMP-binding protein [Chloroflexota bacterium]